MRRAVATVAQLVFWTFVIPSPWAWGATFYVNDTTDTYDGTCDCYTAACSGHCSLRDAVAAASRVTSTGDVIYLASGGVYPLTITPASPYGVESGDLDAKGKITVDVYGGTVVATIDATLLGDRVFEYDGGGTQTLSLSNLVITGGSTGGSGGAIRVEDGVLTATGVEFFSNTGLDGGAIYADADSMVVADACLIELNTASGSGGGVYSRGPLELIDRLFGGGLASYQTLDVGGCSFELNQAESAGGGIWSSDLAPLRTVEDSSFTFNRSEGGGGGVFEAYGAASLSRVEVSYNDSAEAGAGLALAQSESRAGLMSTSLSDCSIQNNKARGLLGSGLWTPGGGLAAYDHLVVQDCEFSGNQGFPASAAWHRGGDSSWERVSVDANECARVNGERCWAIAEWPLAWELGPGEMEMDHVQISGTIEGSGLHVRGGASADITRSSFSLNDDAGVTLGWYYPETAAAKLENVTVAENGSTGWGLGVGLETFNATVTISFATLYNNLGYGPAAPESDLVVQGTGSVTLNSTVAGGCWGAVVDNDYNRLDASYGHTGSCSFTAAHSYEYMAAGAVDSFPLGYYGGSSTLTYQPIGTSTTLFCSWGGSGAWGAIHPLMVDTGDPLACPAEDQAGRPRPTSASWLGWVPCDAGAYESFDYSCVPDSL